MTHSAIDRSSPGRLPADLTLEGVHLVINDLDRSVAWYEHTLGLRTMSRTASTAEMGDGEVPVVTLHEDRGADSGHRNAGIYHYALLFPTRAELARAAARLATQRQPIEGASDHRTHEAVYLRDPDGIGIELAADRPRAAWPADMGYSAGPAPLDLTDLLRTIAGEPTAPHAGAGLRLGHMHLHVNDIGTAVAFYRDTLGFHVTADLGTAVFFAAGDYHHHLAGNVWRGQGIPPQPTRTVGLRHWDVRLPSAADLDALLARLASAGVPVHPVEEGFLVRDPAGIPLRVGVRR